MVSLRNYARVAYDNQLAEQKVVEDRRKLERQAKARKAFEVMFPDVPIDGQTDNIIRSGDVTLRYVPGDGFQVEGLCPGCSEKCWSRAACSAAEVGAMLADFRPVSHECYNPKVVRQSTGDRLADLIREIAGEVAE